MTYRRRPSELSQTVTCRDIPQAPERISEEAALRKAAIFQAQATHISERRTVESEVEQAAEQERAPVVAELKQQALEAQAELQQRQAEQLEAKRIEVEMVRLELEERESEMWAAAKDNQIRQAPQGLEREWNDALLKRRAELSTMQSRRLREQVYTMLHADNPEVDELRQRLEKLKELSEKVVAVEVA